MGRIVYSAVLYLLLPLLFLRLWLKGRKSPNYRKRWAERLGYFSVPKRYKGGICFHCVSVGETMAAVRLIKEIKQLHPQTPVTVTSTTPTGSDQVKATFGDDVFHIYLPFDLPHATRRFFRRLQPKLLVIMETELWPNLLHYADNCGCKTILANARLSQKSARGYQKIKRLTRKMMENIHLVAAHNQQDGNRFIELGLDKEKLSVTGSIKFDIEIDDQLLVDCQALKQQWAEDRLILVAGSTHKGEDEMILSAFSEVLKLHPSALLVLVPRHPERFDEVQQQIKSQGFKSLRRSQNKTPDNSIQVVLGDTMGELKLFWGIADIAFVGGSLIERGGHNPLEPALFAVPVLTGPHVFNFKQIYRLMQEQDAVIITPDQQSLSRSVIQLFDDMQSRQRLGNNAAQVLEQNKGALARLKAHITPLLIN